TLTLHSFPTRRSSDLKLNVEANYSFAYKKHGTGLHFRFFVGRFLYNRDEQLNSRFNYNFFGMEASDYMYNELFVGRNSLGTRFRSEEHTSELQSRENL